MQGAGWSAASAACMLQGSMRGQRPRTGALGHRQAGGCGGLQVDVVRPERPASQPMVSARVAGWQRCTAHHK